MKIVQVCPYAMSRPGGVQRHVRDLSIWLETRGHDVRIIAPPAPGKRPVRQGLLIETGRSRGIALHGTAFELSRASRTELRPLAMELREWGAEIVHLHTPWTPMLARQIWRQLRLPTVTTIHATLPDPAANGLLDRYIRGSARRFLRRSQAVIVPSPAPLDMLRELIPELTAHILPPAINLAPFRTTAPDRDPARPSLLFLGRLEARKGLDILLAAWPAISAALPDATLTIAGDGALRHRITEQDARVRYVGRPDDAAVRRLMARADLFLAPAPYGESYGLVLAEAMAAGAVPVAAANAGYASVLGDRGADLLVPPGDAAALANKVAALFSDPDLLAKRRDWASKKAIDSDVSKVGPAYERIFASVLDS